MNNIKELQNTIELLKLKIDLLEKKNYYLNNLINTNTNRDISLKNRFFTFEKDGFILDNNFDFDAGLRVSGDFINDEKNQYAQMIACALNNFNNMQQNQEDILLLLTELKADLDH